MLSRYQLALIVSLVTAGCGGPGRFYVDAVAPDAATLKMTRDTGTQTFIAFANPECRRTDNMGMMQAFSWTTAQEKVSRLQPGVRVYIHAATYKSEGMEPYNVTTTCDQLVSFKPMASHAYTIRQTLNGKACTTELVDTRTGSTPESFEEHKVPDGCGE